MRLQLALREITENRMNTRKVKFSPPSTNSITDPKVEDLRFHLLESGMAHWKKGQIDAAVSVPTNGPSRHIVMNIFRKSLNEYLAIYNGSNWETLALTEHPDDMELISFWSAQSDCRAPRSHLVSPEALFRAAVLFLPDSGRAQPRRLLNRFRRSRTLKKRTKISSSITKIRGCPECDDATIIYE